MDFFRAINVIRRTYDKETVSRLTKSHNKSAKVNVLYGDFLGISVVVHPTPSSTAEEEEGC